MSRLSPLSPPGNPRGSLRSFQTPQTRTGYPWDSFQSQLILAFNLIVVCAIGVVGVAGLWMIRQQMLDQLHQELQRTIDTASKDLALEAGRLRAHVGPLANHFDVRRAVLFATQAAAPDPTIIGQVAARLHPSSGFDALEIFNRDGRMLGQAPRSPNQTTRDVPSALLPRLLGGQTVEEYVARGSGADLLACYSVYAPITHLDEIIGVFVGSRRLDAASLASIKQRLNHEVSLTWGDRTVISTIPESSTAPFTFKTLTLGEGPLTLAFGISAEPLEAAHRRFQRSFLLMLLLGVLVASWLAIRLSRRMTRPLEALTAAVQRGVVDTLRPAVVTAPQSREVGLLVEAYNQLVHDLQLSRERLVHSERLAAWRDVARKIAHEIKNPLTPIQTAVESLQRHRDHAEFPKHFDQSSAIILQEIDRLKRFVNEFAQFARLPQFVFEPADLNALIQAVGALHEPMNPRVSLRYELGEIPRPAVDSGQLTAALTNLVKNAYEAMPDGGTLTLRSRKATPEDVAIECEDTGPGLSEKARAKLFTPYFTTKSTGTGLGLAMVHEIVRAHQGTIQVDSEPNHGTLIVITLPLKGPS